MRKAMWVGGDIIGIGKLPMLGVNKKVKPSEPTVPEPDPFTALFEAGEQGFWYDPNDLSTMFQDEAGFVPVTGIDQPVGLMLDKSKGFVLEANQMKYPHSESLPGTVSMSDGTHTWSLNTQNPISGVQDSRLVVTNPASSTYQPSLQLLLNAPLKIEKVYRLSFKYKVNSGSPRIAHIFRGQTITEIPSSKGTLSGKGVFELYVRLESNNSSVPLLYFSNKSAFDLQMNEFTIQEVKGNHAYQRTSASRPILRQNAVTGANYLEFDGSDDFLVTNSIDFTVTNKLSLFTGLRKMSDSSYGVVCELSSSWVKNLRSFVVAAPAGSNFPLYGVAARLSYPFNSGQQATSTAHFPAPISNVITAKHSTRTELWINGALNSTTVDGEKGTGNYGNYPLYIGRREGITFPFKGHLYGLIGIGRLTTGDETTAIETELAERVGVTLSV